MIFNPVRSGGGKPKQVEVQISIVGGGIRTIDYMSAGIRKTVTNEGTYLMDAGTLFAVANSTNKNPVKATNARNLRASLNLGVWQVNDA
nr:MAG TPA: hypothetical protein [Caudoviricetes sp.]